jgi:hypothetical protein
MGMQVYLLYPDLQMGLHETKELLQGKGNGHQKGDHIGEMLASYTSYKEVTTRVYGELKKLNSKESRTQ